MSNWTPTSWWRAIDADGSLLAETTDPDDLEALGLVGKPGVTIQRLYEKKLTEWRGEAV